MEKERKAQVTIFIIIGIIIVASVITFFIIKGDILKKQEITPETQNIYSFVKQCIDMTSIDTIYSIGSGGGYYYPPEFSTSSGIPIYYSNGKTYVPTKKQIENEISKNINENLYFCIRDFVEFPGYNVSQGEIKVETEILDNKILLNVDYPLTITKGDKTTYFSKFEDIEIPVRLGIIYSAVSNITQEQLNNKKYSLNGKTKETYCLNCISDIVSKYDLYVDMIDYDEQTMIFRVRDEKSKINNIAFYFQFANRYKIE